MFARYYIQSDIGSLTIASYPSHKSEFSLSCSLYTFLFESVSACDDRKWGVGCNEDCGCANEDEVCGKVDGRCKSGCRSGYEGVGCDQRKSKLNLNICI